jgi:hypothetical protein
MKKICSILLLSTFITTFAKENIYFFINYLNNFDHSKIDEYRESLYSYSAHQNDIFNFNKQEKLFNYFAFKEPFLKDIFKGYNFIITGSFSNLTNVKYVITQEVPRENDLWKSFLKIPKNKRILFSCETQISNPRSHMNQFLKHYHKIFTWNQQFVDNKESFWLPGWIMWTDIHPMVNEIVPFSEKKLCVLVASYMYSNHELSNHKERMEFVNFCEQEPDNNFDIYGTGWPKDKFKNYKGRIPFNGDRTINKINIIKKYKFYLCYENTKNVKGYITEKIFQSFVAGCVPIYSGATNIGDYIPHNCFIDRSAFKNDQELVAFLKSMDEKTYNKYIKNIKAFLSGKEINKYSRQYIAQQIKEALHLQDNEKNSVPEKLRISNTLGLPNLLTQWAMLRFPNIKKSIKKGSLFNA